MVQNSASKSVAKKCGMSEEGILREGVYAKGKYVDVAVASILYDEYRSLAGSI